jgi:hypothetical protein
MTNRSRRSPPKRINRVIANKHCPTQIDAARYNLAQARSVLRPRKNLGVTGEPGGRVSTLAIVVMVGSVQLV